MSNMSAWYRNILLFFGAIGVYLFGVLARVIFVSKQAGKEAFYTDGSFVPFLNHDSGLYGFYARELLSGKILPTDPEYIPGYLLAYISKWFSLPLDTLLFYAPLVIAPLLGVAVYLFALSLKLPREGFFAGLLSAVTLSYFSRTFPGYTDTDMLNLTLPLLSVVFFVLFVERKNIVFALVSVFFMYAFGLWYHSSTPIAFALIATMYLYIAVFDRKVISNYIGFLMIAVSVLPLSYLSICALELVLLSLYYGALRYKIVVDYRVVLALSVVAILGVVFYVGVENFYDRALLYFDKPEFITLASSEGVLKFVGTMPHVQEAQQAIFCDILGQTTGWCYIGFASFFGVLLMFIKQPKTLIALPFLAILAVAYFAGFRFIYFGSWVLLLGSTFLVFYIFNFLIAKLPEIEKQINFAVYLIFAAWLGFMTLKIVGFSHAYENTFLNKQTVEAGKALDEVASDRKDYVITWWDYGWPLWYLANVNTVIDNGRHFKDNYWVAKMFLSQKENYSANLARFLTDMDFQRHRGGYYEATDGMLKEYTLQEVEQKLAQNSIEIKNNHLRTFIFMPDDLLYRYSNMIQFANINPMTGKKMVEKYRFGIYEIAAFQGTRVVGIFGGDKVVVDAAKGIIYHNGEELKIKAFVNVKEKEIKPLYFDADSPYYVVMYNGKLMIMGGKVLDSFLIQALVFNNYDKERFKEIYRGENTLILQVLK